MARLLGVDIPNRKKIEYSLRYIYGIGPTRAKFIVEASGLDPNRQAQDLSEQELNQLAALINEKKFLVEGDLRRKVSEDIKNLKSIKSYRGQRHQRGLPTRGQRTQTNARTRKGPKKTVGAQRKKD